MDHDVQAFIDAIPEAQRPLFDRVDGIIRGEISDIEVVWAYKMPTYQANGHGLHVGVWKHGVSFYGWQADRDGGLAQRYPELSSGKGTLRLSTKAAATITDDELRDFVRAVFAS